MIASNEPDHSLGVTPIGSVGRAPNEKERRKGRIFLLMQVKTRKDKKRSKYF
jgi:hypothetical protein